jgi:hypothetical protein
MDREVKLPWVGDKNTMGRGFENPWVGGSKYHEKGGQNTMGRGRSKSNG